MSTAIYVDIVRQHHEIWSKNRKARINYEKYLTTALNGELLHRAYCYGVQIEGEANSFILALKKMGYEPRYKFAKITYEGRPNILATNRNVKLTLDVVRNIQFVDHIIIGSNDPDLVDLVEWIKERGVKITLYSINIHPELKMAADDFKEIPDEIIEIKND